MMKMRLVFTIGLLIFSGAAVFADFPVVEEAVDKLAESNIEDFSYIKTTFKKAKDKRVKTIEQYNPSLPEEDQWKLVLWEDNKPTPKTIKKYLKNRAKERKTIEKARKNGKSGSRGSFSLFAGTLYEEGSLQLLYENDDETAFRFTPAPGDGAGFGKFMDKLEGRMIIDTKGKYITKLTYTAGGSFSPMFGVKVDDLFFEVIFDIATENGIVLIKEMKSRFKGNAFILKNFDEDVHVFYTDIVVPS